MSDNKAIAKLETTTLQDMQTMAHAVAKSGLFGDIRTPEAALALMLICQSEGMHPMRAMQTFHIIKGKPSKRADAILAEFQSRGGIVEWHDMDTTKCSATFEGPGIKKPLTLTWTLEDAKVAGLMQNDQWRKYPRAMLRARVISEGVRAVMPGVIAGFYTPEEVNDFTEGPAQQVAPQSKVWDKFKDTPANESTVSQEAEYVDAPAPVEAETLQAPAPEAPASNKLTLPADDCDRLPEVIVGTNRTLTAIGCKPFNEHTPEELKDANSALERMSRTAKDPHNRAALQVYAAFVRRELAARQGAA